MVTFIESTSFSETVDNEQPDVQILGLSPVFVHDALRPQKPCGLLGLYPVSK